MKRDSDPLLIGVILVLMVMIFLSGIKFATIDVRLERIERIVKKVN